MLVFAAVDREQHQASSKKTSAEGMRSRPAGVRRIRQPMSSMVSKMPVRAQRRVRAVIVWPSCAARASQARRVASNPAARSESRAAKAGASASSSASGETRAWGGERHGPRGAGADLRHAGCCGEVDAEAHGQRAPVAFQEDAGELAALPQQVVGPFEREGPRPPRQARQRVVEREPRGEGPRRGLLRGAGVRQGERGGEIAGPHRPGPPAAAAGGGLAAGEDPGGARGRAPQRLGVGAVGLVEEEALDALGPAGPRLTRQAKPPPGPPGPRSRTG